MHIVHLSWEFPPVIYGGLGRHVTALTAAQARAGHQVTVFTSRAPSTPARHTVNGVNAIRVRPPSSHVPREPDALVDWTLELDSRMADAVLNHLPTLEPDIVHAHDWVVEASSYAARTVADVPLVTTMHATEAGRHQGWITNDLSRTIHGLEQRIVHRSARVIACSRAMSRELVTAFALPEATIAVVANGVDLPHRGRYRPEVQSPHVVFIGRLEWEKGVHVLIDAFVTVLRRYPNAHLTIAGTGTYEQALRAQATERLPAGVVTFSGWLNDAELTTLRQSATCIAVPSVYEPFGLVALEAAAAEVPVVVSDAGGLSDIVTDPVTGRVHPAGDVSALAACLVETINDAPAARERAARLREIVVRDYTWASVSAHTGQVYADALQAHLAGAADNDPSLPGRVHQNVLTGELAP